jgi:hypothetical protein
MDIKTIKKLSNILAEIEVLDAEVMRIEKTALLIADKPTNCTLKISFENPLKEENKKILDGDGSLINNDAPDYYGSIFRSMMYGMPSKSSKPDTRYHHKEHINEVTTLHILNFILMQKNKERELLLKEIQKYQN